MAGSKRNLLWSRRQVNASKDQRTTKQDSSGGRFTQNKICQYSRTQRFDQRDYGNHGCGDILQYPVIGGMTDELRKGRQQENPSIGSWRISKRRLAGSQ